jgi:large subunit ribosomal protein L24
MKLKIKRNDMVEVISGNDKGVRGRVLRVNAEKQTVLVEGVNIRKKHSKPTQQNPKGGILSKEMPVHYSNVLLLDSDKNPTRIGIRIEDKGDKRTAVRFSRKNGKDI